MRDEFLKSVINFLQVSIGFKYQKLFTFSQSNSFFRFLETHTGINDIPLWKHHFFY